MAQIVNVEGISFSDLRPFLERDIHVREAHDNADEKNRVFNLLEKLFNELKKGRTIDHFLMGIAISNCLNKMNRKLLSCEHPHYDHDYTVVPITKKFLKRFLSNI